MDILKSEYHAHWVVDIQLLLLSRLAKPYLVMALVTRCRGLLLSPLPPRLGGIDS